MWLDVIIRWIKAFFGTVVFWTGIAGVLLVLVTMIRYRVRRGKRAGELSQKSDGDAYADRICADRTYADRTYADRTYADRTNADRTYADRTNADRTYADRTNVDRTYADRPNVAARLPWSAVAEDSGLVRNIALITGASSGIGRAFALRIDQTEAEIDEIWLVARRQKKLEALAGELKHETRIIAADLTEGLNAENYENPLTRALAGDYEPECIRSDINRAISENNILSSDNPRRNVRIKILMNAAGFAKIGNYAKVSFQDSMRMIDLNDKAAVAVTLACLPYMSRGDRILQMCSTAAFQPLQHINIYGASKVFLYHYTRALRMELFPRGIAVTAVCPFWVKDTEFIGIAQGEDDLKASADAETPLADSKPPIKHFPFATTAEKVAKRGLRANRAGWAVVTPGAFCVIHRFFTKLLPREAAIWIWELMRRM